MTSFAFSGNAQTFNTSITGEETPKKAITHVSGTEMGSDDYDVSIFLAATQEVIDEIGIFDFEEAMYINGKRINSETIYTRYEKSSEGDADDFLVTPSIKLTISIQTSVEDNADLVIEKGNKLKIEFLHEDDQRVLGTAEITFDVPGYKQIDSDFCELYDTRNTDKKVEATLHAMFKMMYPHEEIVETLTDGEWGDFKGFKGEPYGEHLAYMIIYKYKGKLWRLRYLASYVLEDGVLLEKPRVAIYNGLADPIPVNADCFKALQATFN